MHVLYQIYIFKRWVKCHSYICITMIQVKKNIKIKLQDQGCQVRIIGTHKKVFTQGTRM